MAAGKEAQEAGTLRAAATDAAPGRVLPQSWAGPVPTAQRLGQAGLALLWRPGALPRHLDQRSQTAGTPRGTAVPGRHWPPQTRCALAES